MLAVMGIASIFVVFALVITDFGDKAEEVRNTEKSESAKVGKYEVMEFEMYYSPGCNCCEKYAAYLREMNYTVRQIETSEVMEIKNRFGIPRELWSCHTVKAGNYFVEGHVPVEAIQKLMAENPEIKGISLPKMPPGSPGMGGNKTGPFTIYYVSEGEKGEFMVI